MINIMLLAAKNVINLIVCSWLWRGACQGGMPAELPVEVLLQLTVKHVKVDGLHALFRREYIGGQ